MPDEKFYTYKVFMVGLNSPLLIKSHSSQPHEVYRELGVNQGGCITAMGASLVINLAHMICIMETDLG